MVENEPLLKYKTAISVPQAQSIISGNVKAKVIKDGPHGDYKKDIQNYFSSS